MVVVLVKIVLLSIDFTNNIHLKELNETAKKPAYASSTHLFELLVHGGGDGVRFLHLVTNHLRHHVSHRHHPLYRPAGNEKYTSLEFAKDVIYNAWLRHWPWTFVPWNAHVLKITCWQVFTESFMALALETFWVSNTKGLGYRQIPGLEGQGQI